MNFSNNVLVRKIKDNRGATLACPRPSRPSSTVSPFRKPSPTKRTPNKKRNIQEVADGIHRECPLPDSLSWTRSNQYIFKNPEAWMEIQSRSATSLAASNRNNPVPRIAKLHRGSECRLAFSQESMWAGLLPSGVEMETPDPSSLAWKSLGLWFRENLQLIIDQWFPHVPPCSPMFPHVPPNKDMDQRGGLKGQRFEDSRILGILGVLRHWTPSSQCLVMSGVSNPRCT